MPYDSVVELPKQTNDLTPKEKRVFKQAFNSAMADGKNEKSAFKIAWHAVNSVKKRNTVSKEESIKKDERVDDPIIIMEVNDKPPRPNVGAWLESRLHWELTRLADDLYGDGKLSREQRIALSSAIGQALDRYAEVIEEKSPSIYETDRYTGTKIKKLGMAWNSPDGHKALEEKLQANSKWLSKHLIGRHNQQDHDPTKGGHTREQHSKMPRPLLEQAALTATLGSLSAWQAAKPASKKPGTQSHGLAARALYGLYALNFLLGTLSNIDRAKAAQTELEGREIEAPVKKAKTESDLGDFLEVLSESSGVRPGQILEDFGEWLMKKKIIEPTKEDLHEFMIQSYGDGEEDD